MESYETPSDITWDNTNPYKLIGEFIVSDNLYRIDCILYDNDIWTYKFSGFDPSSNTFTQDLVTTNPNDKMKVIGTIRTGMEYLIDIKHPKSIIYAALDDSDGRKKLYSRFSNEIVKKFGYQYRTSLQDSKQVFILYKDISIKLVIDVIGEIMNVI